MKRRKRERERESARLNSVGDGEKRPEMVWAVSS